MSGGFDAGFFIDRLGRFPRLLRELVEGITPEQARERGPEGQWSIVEIVAHLADEEHEDFPVRLRLIIEDPEAEWPKIDPEGWASEREYLTRDLDTELTRLETKRDEHMVWLRSIEREQDWSVGVARAIGTMHAADMLSAWCDHDVLHTRQITKRIHELVQKNASPYRTGYAGQW
jgi:hypothetical protein